uniref:hypothetical protein n=2 Tax=Roseivirga sp. TaxID=1964215 RepID=UPI0040489416
MKALKWIAVLPASLLALILSNLIWRLLHSLTASRYIDTDSWLNLIFVDIMSSALASAAFIYAGTFIAPNYKKETALVLTILISMISGASLFIVNVMTAEYFSNVGIIAGIVGAVACYFEIQQSEKEK